MYTITKDRANELMLMHLTARREQERIMLDRNVAYASERLEVLDRLIDVLMDEGIEAMRLEMDEQYLLLDKDGDSRRKISIKVTLRVLMSMSSDFISAIALA